MIPRPLRQRNCSVPDGSAALAWVEALTAITDGHAPDAAYDAARSQFSERELVDLTVAAAQINAWNRIAIALRTEPGSYRPPGR